MFKEKEVLETIKMVSLDQLDIRTVTLGINLKDCRGASAKETAEKVFSKIVRVGGRLLSVAKEVEEEFGVPIVNKRISLTPLGFIVDGYTEDEVVEIGLSMERAAVETGVDYMGGFSAIVIKGITPGERTLIETIPEVLARTERVCSSLTVASTRSGINMDAVLLAARTVKRIAEKTSHAMGIGCAKFVVFANPSSDIPFIAGAFHGVEEGEAVVNVGISGPGVVLDAVKKAKGKSLGEVAEVVKRTAFKITRTGELVGREVAKRLNAEFGVVDVSLAPTPSPGDSVAEILEALGVEVGAPGSTAALALLTDAVKKGGVMASSSVGGFSGAFIPVSEDRGMVEAVKKGNLSIEKLEAMTAVCSVGLDMIAIPGDTDVDTIAGIIADEMAIGVMTGKTTGVRIIPVPGKKAGEWVEYGGLLGFTPVLEVRNAPPSSFVRRGGRLPPPIFSFRN